MNEALAAETGQDMARLAASTSPHSPGSPPRYLVALLPVIVAVLPLLVLTLIAIFPLVAATNLEEALFRLFKDKLVVLVQPQNDDDNDASSSSSSSAHLDSDPDRISAWPKKSPLFALSADWSKFPATVLIWRSFSFSL